MPDRPNILLKRHQRVRLHVIVRPAPTEGLGPSNAAHEWGTYHTAAIEEDRIRIRSSQTWGPPFAVSVQLPPGAPLEPELAYDANRRLWLVYTDAPNDAPDVWRRVSDDEGETWSDAEMAIPGGKHPDIAKGLDGTLVVAAWVDGVIQAQALAPGSQAWSAVVPFKDATGADLQWEDDSFGLVQTHAGHAPWWLHAVAAGDTSTSNWWSADTSEIDDTGRPPTWARDPNG